MSLSQQSKCELQWWCDNVMTAHNVISHVEPQYQITTDGGPNMTAYPQGGVGPMWKPSTT